MSRGARVWQVGSEGPRRLVEVLDAMGAEPGALGEGRVFVGRRRVHDASLVLAPGDRVQVHAARAGTEGAYVVERANGFVIAFKPAALPTEPDRTGDACLLHALGIEGLHAVSRLDVGVSGLVLLSENRAAHKRAVDLEITRRYVAIAERAPEPESGRVDTPVDGRDAETRYAVVARALPHALPSGERVSPALLVFDLVTGRKHQLRVHAKTLGAPLLGDRAYGGVRRLTTETGSVLEIRRIMLHAARVELPGLGASLPPPADFQAVWSSLGGEETALAQTLTMTTSG